MTLPYIGAAKAIWLFPFSLVWHRYRGHQIGRRHVGSVAILGVGRFLSHQGAPVGTLCGVLFLAILLLGLDEASQKRSLWGDKERSEALRNKLPATFGARRIAGNALFLLFGRAVRIGSNRAPSVSGRRDSGAVVSAPHPLEWSCAKP